MTAARAVLVAITILVMAASLLLIQGMSPSSSGGPAFASVEQGNGNHGRHRGNENRRHHNGNDGHRHHNRNHNRNENEEAAPAPPRVVTVARPAPPACSTPGQESVFSTDNPRPIAVRVFGSMFRSIRITIRPVDPSSVPAVPGRLVDTLVFELIAEDCGGGGLADLPAEVNLGIHYTDADAAGLNEASFVIASLDQSSSTWQPTTKQAPDPGPNYTSATI